MAKADTSGNSPAENAPENAPENASENKTGKGQPGGNVASLRPYERMVKQLQGIAKLEQENGSGFDIAANVVDKMLSVETDDIDALIDGVLSAGSDGPMKAEDMEHKPFIVRDVTWLKSAEAFEKGGFGTYAVVKAANPITMEDIIFSVGATNVVTALFTFWQKGVFESEKNPALVIRSRPTPNGKLFYLVRA